MNPSESNGEEDGCLSRALADVRSQTVALAAPLSAEDQCAQSMPDASPVKWHLAHTTWFFESVVLQQHLPEYEVFDSRYQYLFNSYYEALGPRHPRPERGLLTRPSLDEVMLYRQHVDRGLARLLAGRVKPEALELVVLGLHHEQQHQELLLTDVKHLFSRNALLPAYDASPARTPAASEATVAGWVEQDGGPVEIGFSGGAFAFDNERPRHTHWLTPFELATHPVTAGQYCAFIEDGGYDRPEFWLSEGWATVQALGWRAPLYWRPDVNGEWRIFTLRGMQPLNPNEPVCHVSFFEAAAYAAWANARLPREFEWEAVAQRFPESFRSKRNVDLHPRPSASVNKPGAPAFGEVWEWTRSSYEPYPRFMPFQGAVAEYNGKFMVGQIVLRGGSCVTPHGHIRPTYRNFFPPTARWQFSGIRLARDL